MSHLAKWLSPQNSPPRIKSTENKKGENFMLPCLGCNAPLTQFPIEQSDVDLMACDGCQGVYLNRPGEELEAVDDITFDELVEAYGTDFPMDVDPSTITLPYAVEDALA
jgi:hypothetical protein